MSDDALDELTEAKQAIDRARRQLREQVQMLARVDATLVANCERIIDGRMKMSAEDLAEGLLEERGKIRRQYGDTTPRQTPGGDEDE